MGFCINQNKIIYAALTRNSQISMTYYNENVSCSVDMFISVQLKVLFHISSIHDLGLT